MAGQNEVDESASHGPLAGIRAIEFAGIGPGPMCGMLLADMGADVLRVERLQPSGLGFERPAEFDLLNRSKSAIKVNLKDPEGVAFALQLIERADALIEGFRPGAMERLGLGPETCLQANAALVYGRMTGYGQTGPLAQVAGHDLNYIALAGVLHGIGRDGAPPTPPLNLIGDFGGGAMLLALGIVSALLSARRTGHGQVVDAAMIDGAALLSTSFWGLRAGGVHSGPRGTNLLDSGAPQYDVYCCADGEYVAVAPLERKFRQILLERVGIDPATDGWDDPSEWRSLKERLSHVFAQKTRQQWCDLLEGTDACFAPVLAPQEAASHPHNVERATFIRVNGITQPAPAPRFGRTPASHPLPPDTSGSRGMKCLAHWGIDAETVGRLIERGIVCRNG